MPKRRASDMDTQSNEPVTFESCRAIRNECSGNIHKIIGALVVVFLGIVGILYSLNTTVSSKVAEAREEIAAEKASIRNIDERTKEMQGDIKQLLQKR